MPSASSSEFCANVLKVLADETRLRVVRALFSGPKHVGEINQDLGLEQSLLSYHLRVLREHGVVDAERDGKAVLYRLASSARSRDGGETIDLGCC
ncbi:MAG TPA: metalloregulator ArsR/SmtB family transcription factor, partial [Planctomycetota bacterium]|nr:metalloregulator ArsR/SmtB family transcription factor [Planctomycetota bacterium]